MAEKSTKSFILRVDADTINAIETWAADEFRSTNGQLQWIITEALRKAKRLPRKVNTLLLLLALWGFTLPAIAQEQAYYLVGWLNGWSTTDKSYPLTQKPDGLWWEITVPAAGNDGWFKVAPASAYGKENFWDNLLCASYNGCRDLTGEMKYGYELESGNQGAWRLPDIGGTDTYTISINPTEMVFTITPNKVEVTWSGTLPVLFINTQDQQPVTSKETYLSGTFYIDNLGLEGYQSLGSAEAPLPLEIKGRGNWTWTSFDKKPYRLKFGAKQQPLGMKKSKHFNLLACADDDMAFLRNTVGMELSRRLGLAYTPEQRPVELVLNGEYMGLYLLTDKIRVESTRVNIVEQNDNETDPALITGGWLIEIDNYDEENQLKISEGNGRTIHFTYHSPEVLSDEQRDYMTNFLTQTDRAIYSTDKGSTDWERYIDIDALARFYIVQEVMDDAESFHGSCYFSKERGDDTKIVFGPVWDFGNAFRRGFDKFIYENPPFDQYWIGEIARFPRFQQTVKGYWQSFVANDYATLDSFIDSFIAQIASAAASDGRRWPQYSQSNIGGRRDHFKDCLRQKVNFLLQKWGGTLGIDLHTYPSVENYGSIYTIDGRKIENRESEIRKLPKGIYIYNGRKIVIK